MTPDEIRERRKALHLSRTEFARRLPVPLRTAEHWEHGDRQPPAYLWRALRDLERELAAE